MENQFCLGFLTAWCLAAVMAIAMEEKRIAFLPLLIGAFCFYVSAVL